MSFQIVYDNWFKIMPTIKYCFDFQLDGELCNPLQIISTELHCYNLLVNKSIDSKWSSYSQEFNMIEEIQILNILQFWFTTQIFETISKL